MSSQPSSDKNMPFVAHLIELRDRLLKMLLAVLVVFIGLLPFTNDLFRLLADPLLRFLPVGTQMLAIDVATPFFTPLKVAFMIAVLLAMPYIFYHIWAFVAPGLYKHEKEIILPLLLSSTLLFYLGMLFAYFAVFPFVFGFMVSTTPDGVTMATDIARYLDFVLGMFFAFGIAFEVPVATVLLVWIGVITADELAQKRSHIIVGSFAVAMVLTPPDVFSQILMAVSMCLLFELGLVFARAVEVRKRRREQEEARDLSPTVVSQQEKE